VAVNSFGFGGTNSHVVLEAAAPYESSRNSRQQLSPRKEIDRPRLLPISARDDLALRNYVKAYARMLRDSSISLSDLCYSAGA
jgi:acyl transferase domain-containing protein